MKKLYVDIDAIIASNDGLLFENDVIHNLYNINNQLNYDLIIITETELPVFVKAFEVLKNESIRFDVKNNSDIVDENDRHISKENLTNWNKVF